MKILEELWYGNINPSEHDVKSGSQAHKLSTLIARNEEALLQMLSAQEKETYEKLRDCQSELHELNKCDAFCTGFRLGARIAYETMEGSDIPSIDD